MQAVANDAAAAQSRIEVYDENSMALAVEMSLAEQEDAADGAERADQRDGNLERLSR